MGMKFLRISQCIGISQKFILLKIIQVDKCAVAIAKYARWCWKLSLELDLCRPIVKKLPDPNGELSATVSPEAIQEANKEVPAAMEVTKQGNRKPYKQISDMLRASIGRYALENDNAGAVRKYSN